VCRVGVIFCLEKKVKEKIESKNKKEDKAGQK